VEKLLDTNDLINLEHSPVHDLINACYLMGSFKNAVKYLSSKVGFGIDMGGFTFWSDLDEYDKTFYEEEFTGIEIELGSESVILDYEIMYYYLKLAAMRYVRKNPQYEQEFERYFEDMRENLDIKNTSKN